MKQLLAISILLVGSCAAERTPVSAGDHQTDLDAIVTTTLTHPDMAKYLHPEVPGRLPVKVAFRHPAGVSTLSVILFGQPAQLADSLDPQNSVVLRIIIKGDDATVDLEYAPEGVLGHMTLRNSGHTWVVVASQLREQRPNNSFKPKPLRGSA